MALSKSLTTVLAVLLIAAGGVAAVGMAQTATNASDAEAGVSALEMDATLDNGTVTVTVADDGTPVENASLAVEAGGEVTAVTDAEGVATVNASALAEDNESIEELEVEYETDHAEGSLEYVVENGSLTLVEEEYEYEVEDEEDDEREEDDEDAEDEEDDEDDEDEDAEGEESEEEEESEEDDEEDDEDDEDEDDEE